MKSTIHRLLPSVFAASAMTLVAVPLQAQEDFQFATASLSNASALTISNVTLISADQPTLSIYDASNVTPANVSVGGGDLMLASGSPETNLNDEITTTLVLNGLGAAGSAVAIGAVALSPVGMAAGLAAASAGLILTYNSVNIAVALHSYYLGTTGQEALASSYLEQSNQALKDAKNVTASRAGFFALVYTSAFGSSPEEALDAAATASAIESLYKFPSISKDYGSSFKNGVSQLNKALGTLRALDKILGGPIQTTISPHQPQPQDPTSPSPNSPQVGFNGVLNNPTPSTIWPTPRVREDYVSPMSPMENPGNPTIDGGFSPFDNGPTPIMNDEPVPAVVEMPPVIIEPFDDEPPANIEGNGVRIGGLGEMPADYDPDIGKSSVNPRTPTDHIAEWMEQPMDGIVMGLPNPVTRHDMLVEVMEHQIGGDVLRVPNPVTRRDMLGYVMQDPSLDVLDSQGNSGIPLEQLIEGSADTRSTQPDSPSSNLTKTRDAPATIDTSWMPKRRLYNICSDLAWSDPLATEKSSFENDLASNMNNAPIRNSIRSTIEDYDNGASPHLSLAEQEAKLQSEKKAKSRFLFCASPEEQRLAKLFEGSLNREAVDISKVLARAAARVVASKTDVADLKAPVPSV